MKFRYIEDYEKMKKINKMLYEIIKKMYITKLTRFSSDNLINFIYELEEETKNLLKLVGKCNFLNIDYDDGKVFVNKFRSIYIFRADRGNINFIFRKLLAKLKSNAYDGFSINLYDILEKEIYPSLKKIYKELRRRGIKLRLLLSHNKRLKHFIFTYNKK